MVRSNGIEREVARRMGAARAWLLACAAEDILALPELQRAADGAGPLLVRVPAGPELTVADLRALGRDAREPATRAKDAAASGTLGYDPATLNDFLVVDVSPVSCAGLPAVQLGAHLVLDDLSLALADAPVASPLTAVGISRDADRTRPGLTRALDTLRAAHEPADARLQALADGFATLDERLRVLNDHAAVLAAFLAAHPRVADTFYPGLPGHPDHETAAQQLRGGFGPTVAYRDAAVSIHTLHATPEDPLATCTTIEATLRA